MNRRQRRRRARIRQALVITPPVVAMVGYLVGLALPPVRSEDVTREVGSSPETVWAVLMDVDAMPDWRADLRQVERLPDLEGDARWVERTDGGIRTLRRIALEPPARLVVALDPARTVEWEYRLERRAPGSAISITQRVRIANPLRRPWVALFGIDRQPLEELADGLALRAGGVRQVAIGSAGWRHQSESMPQRDRALAR